MVALLLALFVLGLAAFLWWLRTLLDLLREGPTVSSEGWLASVIIVTILGPFGVLVYRATRPDRHRARSART